MQILKRNGIKEAFAPQKIERAILSAFESEKEQIKKTDLESIIKSIEEIKSSNWQKGILMTVEQIQDYVEEKLMERNYYKVAKSYILYRKEHAKNREMIKKFNEILPDNQLIARLKKIQYGFEPELYSLEHLYIKFKSFISQELNQTEKYNRLIKAAVELTSKEAPKWEFIAAQFLNDKINSDIDKKMQELHIKSFAQKIKYLEEQGLYGKYIRQHYSDEEIGQLEKVLDTARNDLLTYSSLDMLYKRYMIRSHDQVVLEKTQEMFMGIAMHLAMPEGKNKVAWAKRIYNILSKLKVTMATPTMANARKPFHQLSSCFIDTVPDSLDGIYRSIDNFAQISKFGGGMGLYFGKVRAIGSDIRGHKGAAGGVNRWIKLANSTAVAVDQLGVRQGAVAVYLDVWHRDIPEFLQLKTNNGDDRLKAHDVFPAINYPNLFWKLAKENIDATWYLMCPHEIFAVKGYALEDYYGEAWEKRYHECVADPKIQKREISVKELVRLIIKSVTETGTPFAFNRDHVNEMNPNNHSGMIYSSNLCTEIAQNMKAIESMTTEIKTEEGDTVVVTKTKPGDMVVCNLASLVLGKIDTDNAAELEEVVTTVVRALDNVIDLNYYPVPYAQITNQRYRAIGLGTSGYHHLLANKSIRWESEEHLTFMDALYEKINYYAIKASSEIAKEKGSYAYFAGSDWQTGAYFSKRGYESPQWQALKESVAANGMRNGYLMAIAPTASTSIIAGTTAAIDPVMNRFFLEEKKGSILPRVAPDLNAKTLWFYKSAHTIDQEWVVRAAGVRQRHVDQAQSLNIYITTEFTMRQLMELYIQAWENGIKTIYYVRSKSLEVEECEMCSS